MKLVIFRIMAYYYKFESPELQEFENQNTCKRDLFLYANDHVNSNYQPSISYDFSKYVLVELLDDFTPVKKIWDLLGFSNNKAIIRKRIMLDPHRLKCRRVIAICSSSVNARTIVNTLKGKTIGDRQICTIVVEDLLGDIKLFENEIIKYGDTKPQQKLVYVSNLNRYRRVAGLVNFLSEKFSPFGTIISVLVSEDSNGYALGEAVIRFSYFSEAFAAELAYDECVIGKERLHVTMQHNILLCECDLRARLRESLKFYQTKNSAVPSFRQSVNSIKSSNDEVKLSFDIPSESATPLKSLNNVILDVCEQYKNDMPVELVCSTQANKKEAYSAKASDDLCISLESNCSQVSEISEITFKDIITSQSSDEFQLSSNCGLSLNDNESSSITNNSFQENVNGSWSSKIINWVRSFVSPSDNYSEKNMSNTPVTCVNDETLHLEDISLQEKYLNISNVSETKFLLTADMQNLSNIHQIHQKCHLDEKNLPLVHNTNQNKSTACNTKTQKRHKKLVCNGSNIVDNKENINSSTHIDAQQKRSTCTNYSKTMPLSNKCNITTRSKKKHISTPLLDASSLKHSQTDTFISFDLPKQSEKNELEIKTISPFSSINNVCATNLQQKLKSVFPRINYTPESHSEFSKKSLSVFISNEYTYDSLNSTHINSLTKGSNSLNEISHTNALHFQNVQNLKGLNDQISDDNQHKIVPVKNNYVSSDKLKDDELQSMNAKLSLPFISPINQRQHSKTIRSTLSNKSSDCSLTSESPIRWWLKKHLLYSVNNRVTTNGDKPDGLVFATMTKDTFIHVGCSHMVCDNCYPDASNLIFGL